MGEKIRPFSMLDFSLLAAVIFVLLWLYWATLSNLIYQISTNEDYSFALLLPFVSIYIIYYKRHNIPPSSWQPSWLGIFLIIFGLCLYVFSELVAVIYFAPISFFVIIVGFIFLIAGKKIIFQLIFPLLLLFFMVPLPSFLIKKLTLPLQLISSHLAAGLLGILNIPYMQQGNIFDMGVRQLQVVEACSGLRYVLSLIALSSIFCYFYQRRFWKAALLVITVIPISILANAIRLAAMAIFPELQEGFLHTLSGWLIFVFCFGFLAVFNWILNYLFPQVNGQYEANSLKKGEPSINHTISFSRYLVAALVLILIAIPLTHRLASTSPMPLLQSFDRFPMAIGSWQGQRKYLDKKLAQAVGADDYLEAIFHNSEESISLWIAFFENQSKKVEWRIHSPVVCLTGGGWRILESKILEVTEKYPVRYLLIERGEQQEVVYYWYLQRGRWLASEYNTKLFMGWDGFVKRRNDGAIIRLITPATPTPEAARHRLSSFAQKLQPLLPSFIPQ